MSLIASTFSQELPFLLGDLLFSSKEGRPDFITPTQMPVYPMSEIYSEYKPMELYQKIYILRDNLALALAGNAYEMKEFICNLKLRLSIYEVLNDEVIKQFLLDFDLNENFSGSSMLMLLVLKQGSEMNYVNRYSYGIWDRLENEHFGSVWASGSGAENFLFQFSTPVSFDADSPRGTVSHSITANLGLLAKWLAIEKSTGVTLRDHWGSGFEMIYFDGQKFVKFQEICFVIFEGRSDENGVTEVVYPSVVMYHFYENDTLFITSLKLEQGSCSQIENRICYCSDKAETTLFVVTPLDLPAGTAITTKQNLSFEANTIAVGYSILNHNQGLFNPSYFLRDGAVSVKFNHGQSVEINVPFEINQQILSGGKAAFEFERNK